MTDPTLYNHGVYAQGFLRGGSTPKQYQQYQKLNTGKLSTYTDREFSETDDY
jgi:hypothetical protein